MSFRRASGTAMSLPPTPSSSAAAGDLLALSRNAPVDRSTPIIATFVFLTRPPVRATRHLSAHDACLNPLANGKAPSRGDAVGDLLACAFATWLPLLEPSTSTIALLFGCQSGADGNETEVPMQWAQAVRAPIVTRCHYGGVCYRTANTTHSLQCAGGTRALMDWLASPTFRASEYFVKVDTDAILSPRAIDEYLRTRLAPARIDYAGDQRHTWNYGYCEGTRSGKQCQPFPKGKPCGPYLCLRSTPGWIGLEASIGGLDVSAAARKAREAAELAEGTRRNMTMFGRPLALGIIYARGLLRFVRTQHGAWPRPNPAAFGAT